MSLASLAWRTEAMRGCYCCSFLKTSPQRSCKKDNKYKLTNFRLENSRNFPDTKRAALERFLLGSNEG